MKKTISLVAVLLIAILMATACNPAVTTAVPTTTATGTATTAATTTEAGPPTKLVISMMTFGAPPADLKLVQDEINKITLAKINVEVELLYINFGAAMEQYNLMLSGNEKLDLMVTFPYTYQGLAVKGQIQEIGSLLDQYGQGIKEVLGEQYLKGSMLNGKIYGVTQARDLAGGYGLNINASVIDKYDIDLSMVKSYEDIGKVLAIIKQNEPESTPLIPAGTSASMLEIYSPYDILGDRFGVLMDNGQDTTVVNWYETDTYAGLVRTMRDWYNKGYILKDAATTQDDQISLLKAGKGYAYVCPTKPGIELQSSNQVGFKCYVQEFSPAKSTTSNVTLFQWVIPTNCTTPDKAMQMLNLQYTDPDIINLLAWGIEGQHYEAQADGTINAPASITAEKPSGYSLNTPWMVGNAYLAKVWTGDPPDLWEQTKAFNNSAIISKAMGFTYDQSPVADEVVALTNVVNQYKKALESGTVDPEIVLPEFIAKLKEAGIDKVVAEKQKQLDAFLAGN